MVDNDILVYGFAEVLVVDSPTKCNETKFSLKAKPQLFIQHSFCFWWKLDTYPTICATVIGTGIGTCILITTSSSTICSTISPTIWTLRSLLTIAAKTQNKPLRQTTISHQMMQSSVRFKVEKSIECPAPYRYVSWFGGAEYPWFILYPW